MQQINLSKSIIKIIEKLDHISLENADEEQQDLIKSCRKELFKFFPQSQILHKFKGKIEDVLVEMHEVFNTRIIDNDEDFTINIDVYCQTNSSLAFGDIHQLNDCIQVHFPHSKFKLSIFNSDSISEDDLLVIVCFKN